MNPQERMAQMMSEQKQVDPGFAVVVRGELTNEVDRTLRLKILRKGLLDWTNENATEVPEQVWKDVWDSVCALDHAIEGLEMESLNVQILLEHKK